MESRTGDITRLLGAWADGDQAALEAIIPIVYRELRRLAHRHMARERPGHSLQTTALVNEAYLKLLDCGGVRWQNRTHFFAVSAQLMRRILVDFARSRDCQKRGAGARQITLDEGLAPGRRESLDLLELDEALSRLGALDARKSQVVEMKFFGGLTVREIADVFHLSEQTVWRDWMFARSWLRREMKRG